jgi:nucleoside-diphosphate-sugar epimerase
LIGWKTVRRFAREGAHVVGIDNDMRARFFGGDASTKKTRDDLIANVERYEHHDLDIRDASAVAGLFQGHRGKIDAIVHTASQPSHDWSARDRQTDFTFNANGTLNLLEAARTFSPEAPFIFASTNKDSNCSMLEAIELCEEISGRKLTWSYEETNRIGDHVWWISDVRKFQKHYPAWKFRYKFAANSGRNSSSSH